MVSRILAAGLVSAAMLLPFAASAATPLATRLSGRMLLQVEQRGRAWYVDPVTRTREAFDRPAELLALSARVGLGVRNVDLGLLPVGIPPQFPGSDADGDGLADNFEGALGTDPTQRDTDKDGFDDRTEVAGGFNPLGAGKQRFDAALAKRLSGRILLQVEASGWAWYVNPVDGKRYFLGKPDQALAVTRSLALGIRDTDLAQIPLTPVPRVACGQTDSIDALLAGDARGKCFAERLRACKPATWRLRSVVEQQTAFIVDQEVVGETTSECLLSTTYVEIGGAPELSGKSMTCRVDRALAADSLDQLLAGNLSFSFSMSPGGTTGTTGIEKCSGPLADAIRQFDGASR